MSMARSSRDRRRFLLRIAEQADAFHRERFTTGDGWAVDQPSHNSRVGVEAEGTTSSVPRVDELRQTNRDR